LENFPLLIHRLCYIYLWFAPFFILQCPWFTGLVSWCNHWVCGFLLKVLILLSKNSSVEYLFCFGALEFCFLLVLVCWSDFQLYVLFDLWNFLFPGFFLDSFSEVFHIFIKILFWILCGFLYFIYIFSYNLLSFILEFGEVLSDFI
jgi:hypothetical protein